MGGVFQGLKNIFSVIACCLALWVALPRVVPFGDQFEIYSMYLQNCDSNFHCEPQDFLPPMRARVNPSNQSIAVKTEGSRDLFSWLSCTIIDNQNWTCRDPNVSMIDGIIQGDWGGIEYLPGWQYRLYKIASLFPKE